jgi:DGQHR domain-containing protein
LSKLIEFKGLVAEQSVSHTTLTIAATAEEILSFARIDRIGRDQQGDLFGFQRPQIAAHIKEIGDYLEKDDAVLPNAIVVAFTKNVRVTRPENGIVTLKIDCNNGPPGLVVDGQQRLSALSSIPGKDFQMFVSVLVCPDEEELRRQFILINNTRPLPKSLIYELLPSVDGLPNRLSSRSFAAELVARLNHREDSSLRGLVHQHTNPDGTIKDTTLQKVIMSSYSDGAIREFLSSDEAFERAFVLVSNFYGAVQKVFPEAWNNHTPRTSRLVHGAGIQALGYVMEVVYAWERSTEEQVFERHLQRLEPFVAWTKGSWAFSETDVRPWNKIQNVSRDVIQLADFLIRNLKSAKRRAA